MKLSDEAAVNLLRRLEKQADEVLCFTVDPRIPFSNNDAEREVRMPKVKLKIIGTFRTTEGSRNFCILRSYFSSLKRQGQKLPEYASKTLSEEAFCHCPRAVNPPGVLNSYL